MFPILLRDYLKPFALEAGGRGGPPLHTNLGGSTGSNLGDSTGGNLRDSVGSASSGSANEAHGAAAIAIIGNATKTAEIAPTLP
jgi:hypothetical protein